MREGMLQSRTAKEKVHVGVDGWVVTQESIMVLEMSYAVMLLAPREERRLVEVPVPQARSAHVQYVFRERGKKGSRYRDSVFRGWCRGLWLCWALRVRRPEGL
jgi:hypothetical protein